MGAFTIWHWIIVLLVVLILFGRGRISDIMGDFGKGIKSFKEGISEESGSHHSAPTPVPPAQIAPHAPVPHAHVPPVDSSAVQPVMPVAVPVAPPAPVAAPVPPAPVAPTAPISEPETKPGS